MTESEILFWLSRSRLSVRKQYELIDYAGGISALAEIFRRDAKIKEICADKYSAMSRNLADDVIKEELARLKSSDIGVMTFLNPYYPDRLKQSEVNAPLAMYYKGDLSLLSTPCIAVVGTRANSSYGRYVTESFCETLCAAGFTIVSGLATGIDGYAHKTALELGGKTIAVLGSGLNVVTPVTNAALYDEILQKGGLILSEYPPDQEASKYTFPERNRIISGISKGVLVVEAGRKSGALITAEFAADQGRDVFAVPGNIDSKRSEGTNDLLYNGAIFVRSGKDICDFYGINVEERKKKDLSKTLDNNQKKLYSLLKEGPKSFDDLVEESGFSPADLSSILTELEIVGAVKTTAEDDYVISEN